ILCPVTPINSYSCNYAVKSTKIYSEFTKGHLRIEGNRVVATQCKDNCSSLSENLYIVTIDRHYFLLYHVKSGKFICWNNKFKKLIARRNPTNLTYCKFEEKPSKTFKNYATRYTTNYNNTEKEIIFNRTGFFATSKYINKCMKRHRSISKCVSPDFLQSGPNECNSQLPEFCAKMKIRKDNGHNITPELMDLCK
ncbi:fibroblast growth factor 8, partial [Asbolus verrucosus]